MESIWIILVQFQNGMYQNRPRPPQKTDHALFRTKIQQMTIMCIITRGTPGDRLCENPLLTSITFLIGIYGYRTFIIGLPHN